MRRRREVRRDGDMLITHCYLAISSTGEIRATATPPWLNANEIVMKLAVRVPRALFIKPSLTAEIRIPEEAGSPTTITAETVSNIHDAVRQATGMELAISIVPPDKST